jgi:hypothetical protein
VVGEQSGSSEGAVPHSSARRVGRCTGEGPDYESSVKMDGSVSSTWMRQRSSVGCLDQRATGEVRHWRGRCSGIRTRCRLRSRFSSSG